MAWFVSAVVLAAEERDKYTKFNPMMLQGVRGGGRGEGRFGGGGGDRGYGGGGARFGPPIRTKYR